MARMDKPETRSEYLEFERVRNGYERNGLCDLCAAQASYGHQHGFAVVMPPCPLCLSVVHTFDFPAPNRWRKASRTRLRRGPVWASETIGTSTPPLSDAHSLKKEMAA
jgi:hypothetical protein